MCIYVFCTDLRKRNSDYLPQQLIGFYNPDGVCLLRGTSEYLNKIRFNIKTLKC